LPNGTQICITTLGALKKLINKTDLSGLKQIVIDDADVYFKKDDDLNCQLIYILDKVKGVQF
jgi:hypothetical protein